jgi:hypothetical protein
MKKILSFDIGEITLTYCLLYVQKKSYDIIDWKLNSIRKSSKDSLTNKIDNLLNILKINFPITNDIDYILIEHQGEFRPGMKSIQMVIYTYFKLQDKNVKMRHAIDKFKSNIISDKLKSSIELKKSKYQNNKKLSSEYIKSIIPKEYLDKYIIEIDCIDDYADALFQAIDFLNKEIIN